ncbi:MAG: bifunctional hydroxymethylpyrimidine kinase/phosphomethylpyrimidine kinase [Candidatus Hadarchaeota archaeon]
MKPNIVFTIAGSDSGGGAGLQADLKTFAALEVHGTCIITSVTAQNTRGVRGTNDLPGTFVGKQIDAVAKDFDPTWGKTGMLSNPDIIDVVKEKVSEYDLKLVVDPVMVAASGSSLLKEEAFESLKELVGDSFLVTPNVPEAEKLSGLQIEGYEDVEQATERIFSNLGPKNVLIKGGHLGGKTVKNFLYGKSGIENFETPRIPIPDVHGTGCTFSSAITAKLAKGNDLITSIEEAGHFMVSSIKGRLKIGEGPPTVNPLAEIWKVTDGTREVRQVQNAAKSLSKRKEFAKLIPEVGTNIAMAKKNAEKITDVVGLSGRIVKVGGRPYQTGIPVEGGSEHIANIVLAVQKRNPEYRSAMNIRFSNEIVEKAEDLGLSSAEFNRENEPEGIRTMEWGPKRAIENAGEITDIIYDKGAVGKEPMIRIIGKNAAQVANKALSIMEEMDP